MYAKSQQTIKSILEAARTLFVARNYGDVTITDIVELAEVSKGALYHHFSGKEDLYLKMMHHFLEEIQASTQSAAEKNAGSSRERLYHSSLNFLQLSEELQGILGLVRRDINMFKDPMRGELVRAYQRAVPEQVEKIIRDGIASGELKTIDARLLSRELVALMEVALHPYSRRVIGNPQEMCDFVVGLFLDGVAARIIS